MDRYNGIRTELLCKFTHNNLVRLFKKMLYRHLVIKLPSRGGVID